MRVGRGSQPEAHARAAVLALPPAQRPSRRAALCHAAALDSSVDSKNDEPISVVKKYVNEYQIQIIVVGYPIGLNNSENRMTNLVDQFINELDTLNLEVHKIDERLSSKLFENNKSDRIDDLSALEILESYLSQNE